MIRQGVPSLAREAVAMEIVEEEMTEDAVLVRLCRLAEVRLGSLH